MVRGLACGMGLAVVAFVAAALAAVPAKKPADVRSAPPIRLIMVDEPACRYCRQWDAEVGRGYRKSVEGRFAPLKRVRRGDDLLKGLAPVVYTPTFIVLRSNEEMGRITGYPGADFFYTELRPILAAAGFFPGL